MSLTFAPGWEDPVVRCLKRVNLFPTLDYWHGLDGISYEFLIDHKDVNTRLLFSNPREPSLSALAESLLRLADVMVARAGGKAEREYFARLRSSYLG